MHIASVIKGLQEFWNILGLRALMKELKKLIQWILVIVKPSRDHREQEDAQFSRSFKFKEEKFYDQFSYPFTLTDCFFGYLLFLLLSSKNCERIDIFSLFQNTFVVWSTLKSAILCYLIYLPNVCFLSLVLSVFLSDYVFLKSSGQNQWLFLLRIFIKPRKMF